MNILVMGLGFVGLTTALGLAEKGHIVFGYDASDARVSELASGRVTLFEPGLAEALDRHLGKSFTIMQAPPSDVFDVDIVLICVGTPCGDDGRSDLRYVFSALDMLPLGPDGFNGVVVIKSTVPPDTTKTKIIPYLRKKGITAPVANNPEFLREGYCWDDFINPDRIVCGAHDDAAIQSLKGLYECFNAPIVITSLNTAEFTKYLSNNMLASMISFSNEMSIIAKAIGDISIKQAFEALHMDRRWGSASMRHYVYPGCGFGGYCLPKDLQAMIAHSKSYGVDANYLESVQSINLSMPSHFAEQAVKGEPDSIGILGLSFKPKSDDVRDSPAARIIARLMEKGSRSIYVYDPVANEAFEKNYDFKIIYCESADEVCRQSKTVVLVTAWPQFKGIDKDWPGVRFIDGRYIL